MKIFLVSPHDWFLEHPGDRPPLGIACLSSYLKSIWHETALFDLNHETREQLMEAIKHETPDIICISVSTPNYNSCIALAKEIRASGFTGLLVAGGNHVTDVPNEKPTLEAFDYIVVGDGENGLKKIIEEKSNIKIIVSPPVENLDELPFPDYEGIRLERYSMLIGGEKAITVSSSRGCVYGCVFCGSAKIKKWRPRSPENVVQELELLVNKYNIRAFYFVDDIFTFNKQRVYEICRLMKERLPPIKWRATTRVDLVDYELLKTMKSAGCDVLSFGFESGNEQILRNIRKGASLERTRQTVNWCHELDIKIKGFFIIGLPGETKETAQQTIEFAKSLKIEYCDFYPLTPFPATPLWENPQNFGIEIIKPEGSSWENYYQVGKGGANQILIKHNNLTAEEILEFCKKGREAIKEGMTYY
ncbi:MAG: radical SAM protein [Candidatus Aenigmarchaeota archaeon]|nr:radical SAM protein [Candidatus Aenigmarchaeota archaeon]